MLDRPVFVVGPPRSGTTLVRVMLNRHPDLHILNETHLLDLWVHRYPGLTTGDRAAFGAYWAAFRATPEFAYLEVPADDVEARLERRGRWDAGAVLRALLETAAEVHDVRRAGEKTPDHARFLPELFAAVPDARVVYVLRDPRAVVASELGLDRAWASDDPEEAAGRWLRCTTPWLRWATDERVATLRYEELVTDPGASLERLCGQLGLAPDEGLLADDGGHPAYQHGVHDPWGPLDPGGLDAWRERLDVDARAWVEAVCGDLAPRVGYPLRDRSVSAARLATTRARRTSRRLRRSLAARARRSRP